MKLGPSIDLIDRLLPNVAIPPASVDPRFLGTARILDADTLTCEPARGNMR